MLNELIEVSCKENSTNFLLGYKEIENSGVLDNMFEIK